MFKSLPIPLTMRNFYTYKLIASLLLFTGMLTQPENLFSQKSTVSFSVTRAQAAPVATDDLYLVNEGEILNAVPGVLENDFDPDTGLLAAHSVSAPTHTTAPFNLEENGTFVYQHDGSETTSDVFQYAASDGTLESTPATVTIQIIPVNDAPQISDIGDQSINEGETFSTIPLDELVEDAEELPEDLNWSVGDAGDLIVSIDNESHLASIAIPNDTWIGSETITFHVEDSENGTDSDDATFTVLNVNAPPNSIELSSNTLAENAPPTTVIGIVTATDPDPGDVITLSLPGGDQDNDLFNLNASTGALRKNESANYESKNSYHIRVQAMDAVNETKTENFTINITNVYESPTNITLSANSVAENLAANTLVGTLTTTDPDDGETFTYSLPAGTPDNASFIISGNQLQTAAVFDYETKISYSINIRSTDNNSQSFDKAFIINVNNADDNGPTDIALSLLSIAENLPSNTLVGTLTSTDPDAGETFTYTLPGGTPDNTSFTISGNQLRTAAIFDFETKPSYAIKIRSTDSDLNYYEENFTITVTNVFETPTDITLSASSVAENLIANTVVGTLTTTDPDVGETFTYSLPSGTPDNTAFVITGNQLRTNAIFNFEAKQSYSINIRTTDNHAQSFDKVFTINVTDVLEVPTNITLSATTVAENLPANSLVGTLSTTHPDASETFTYSLPAGSADNASFVISDSELRTAFKFDFETKPSYAINIRTTDSHAHSFDKAFTINVTNVDEGAANITGGGAYCYGVPMPITLNVTGGSGPFNLHLKRTLSSSNIADTAITSISMIPYIIEVRIPGTYTITGITDKDGNPGAFSSTPVVLTVNPQAKVKLTPVTQAICEDGVSLATLHVDFTAGISPYTIKVRRGTAVHDTTMASAADFNFYSRVFDNAFSTRHRIIEIKDKDGCAGDTTGSGSAFVSHKTSPTVVISGGANICPGNTTPLTITLTQGTAPWSFTYVRNNGSPVTITGVTENIHTVSVNAAGTYTISSVEDAVCTGTGSGQAVVTTSIVPVATLTGTAAICEHTSTNLNVAITGTTNPWRFYYRLNSGDSIIVDGITSSPKTIPVSQAGTYTPLKIVDKNNCVGTVSGSAVITIKPAPDVTISGLLPAYNKEVIRVPVNVVPSSASHVNHPALINYEGTLHFWPAVATIGTHNLVFYYQDPTSLCTGYDTATVRVLEAQASIYFENDKIKYCTNDGPFTVTGVNIPNKIGSFTIEGGAGLVNHGDNTATIYPKQLTANNYTLTYTYVDDGASLSLNRTFDVGNKPAANFTWATECYQPGQSISFTNTSVSPFGFLTDTSYYWKIYSASSYVSNTNKNITHTFTEAGNQTIELQIENSYGCADTIVKTFPLRPTIDLMDDYYENFEGAAMGWKSGNTETVNSWQWGTPTAGFTLPPSNTKVWYTKITSSAPPSEHSWVTSPCYDFTLAEKPMIKMNIWRLFNLNTNADGANLQFSADSGKTWNLVGDIADGVNWYNSYVITGLPGGSGIGWSNVKDAGWMESRHSLDMLKGRSRVQFRITYGSDSRVRNTNGIAFDDVSIVDRTRMSFIEHFTNSSDTDTEAADDLLDAFSDSYGANAINIQYHTSSPAGDPFYTDNSQIPNLRQFYYGLSNVPYAVLNGGVSNAQRFDYIENSKPLNPNTVIIESLADSKFEINMDSKVDQVLRTKVQIGARANIPATSISVRIAVIERVIRNVPGQNGDQEFMNVVKAMLPGPAGTVLNRAWAKDEVIEIEKTWELQHVYDARELRVVAFIQNESTHEIYQAALDTIGIIIYDYVYNPVAGDGADFTIYPNPADQYTTLLLNKEIQEDIKLEFFNSMGKLIFSRVISTNDSSIEIPLDSYPDGLYLLRLVTEDRLLGIRKVIISR